MAKEWVGPTPTEILQGIIDAGKTPEQINSGFKMIREALDSGEIRSEIGCGDSVRGFFEMANRFYVKDSDAAISDAEIGIHICGCESPICNRLNKAYFEILRPSRPEDSEQIAKALIDLAEDVLLGKPRPDLNGRKSNYYDSSTSEDLFETKVVEITDKCIETDAAKAMNESGQKMEVLLSYIPFSGGLLCDVGKFYGGSGIRRSFLVGQNTNSENSSFVLSASIVGIETDLFEMIVLANAPKMEQLGGRSSNMMID